MTAPLSMHQVAERQIAREEAAKQKRQLRLAGIDGWRKAIRLATDGRDQEALKAAAEASGAFAQYIAVSPHQAAEA